MHTSFSANINSDCCLNDMVSKDGSWNLELVQVWISNDVIQRIKAIPPPRPFEGPDKISRCHTSTRAFSVKSAYKVLKEGDWNSRDEKWKSAWKLLGPQRVCFFIWTILKQRLLSKMWKESNEAQLLIPLVLFVVMNRKTLCISLEIARLLKMPGTRPLQVIIQ